jgi:hypothetical protein
MNSPQHLEAAEKLLALAEEQVSENVKAQTGEYKTDVLLSVIAHVLIALVKKMPNR